MAQDEDVGDDSEDESFSREAANASLLPDEVPGSEATRTLLRPSAAPSSALLSLAVPDTRPRYPSPAPRPAPSALLSLAVPGFETIRTLHVPAPAPLPPLLPYSPTL
eukprot:1304291-Prymnesium_polylepis.1